MLQTIVAPYPYAILSVDLPSSSELRALIGRRGWEPIEEFIRVEALLRSVKAHELYSNCQRGPRFNGNPMLIQREFGQMFQAMFGVKTDDPLGGDHHAGLYLEEGDADDLRERWLDGGVINLTAQIRHANPRVRAGLAEAMKQRMLNQDSTRYITVEFDLLQPVSKALASVKTLLDSKQSPLPSSPFRDLAAWVKYFRCYDLRMQDLTFGQIAQQVYGTPEGKSWKATKVRQNKYDDAERAYKIVRKIIRAAEVRAWPPRNV